MQGCFALVLHAHLPYVRHPEHAHFLEENWLFEAITESYLPLLDKMEGWRRQGMAARLTLTLTPTLCSMLLDPLLQDRYTRYLETLIELAEKEVHRTQWLAEFHPLAQMYLARFLKAHESYLAYGRNLVQAFRSFQETGELEIITSAATHALLPLLENHPPSIRAQIMVARDHYRSCFGREPLGIWLPECAYVPALEDVLREANIRWFITEAHGLLHAQPAPRYGLFAPVFTPNGLAVFGRDMQSARQVWSKHEGYPGDVDYRDFYRDIGFDLDFDYLKPYLPAAPHRSFTGLKYHAITGSSADKRAYRPEAALRRADRHAQHFLEERLRQINELCGIMDRPPIIVCPYDAELFGHWWYEGPEFLDLFFRKACYDQAAFNFITPGAYLREHTTHQVVRPSPSSWGEGGYWKVWLNEKNEWIYRHLHAAQERMTALARRFPHPTGLAERALKQAARELLLAQASDWPFILRSDSSPRYATKKVKDHLLRFHTLHEQLTLTRVDEEWLERIELMDNIFPEIDHSCWA
jgi:1,4-alpha-glucan branching enzyme